MKDLERAIVFRMRMRMGVYGMLLVLFVMSYALLFISASDTSYQLVMAVILTIAPAMVGLLAYLQYRAMDNYRMIRTIMESTSEGVLVTDSRNRIIFTNGRFLEISKCDYETVLGKDPGYFKSDVHDDAFFDAMWASIHEKRVWQGEIWDKRSDGTLYTKDLTIRTVGGHRNNPRYHIGIFRDLSPYKTLKDQNMFERYHFIPTGLPNERRIKALMASNIVKERLFQLHYIRITNYSYLVSVHEAQGFYDALKEVKKRIEALKDPVILGQIDRETLLLIREGPYDSMAFEAWLRRLNDAIESPVASMMKFDVSIGIALCPEHDDAPEGLLTKAALAFDYTSGSGTRNHAIYDPGYHKTISDQYRMRDAIIKGLKNHEFSLVYHPIHNKASGSLFGVEALLRWHSSIYGDVSPEAFIPVAEKFYLMNRIGGFVIEAAMRDKAKLDSRLEQAITMSINTSATQYENDFLYETLKRAIGKRSINPGEIIIEITESSIMENLEKTVEYLNRLRALGVKIALDDFGTGFSSLSYLRNMPINYVKIDREFVRFYPRNDDGTLAKTIIKVGQDLDLKVIAEGVETEEQANMLESHGCRFFQGFHYGQPLPFDDLLQFILDHKQDQEQ